MKGRTLDSHNDSFEYDLVDLENYIPLGFGNNRSRKPEEDETPEGYCGKEYRYRVRTEVPVGNVDPDLKYDTPLADFESGSAQ